MWYILVYYSPLRQRFNSNFKSSCLLATQMFLMPTLITMSIVATRIYRCLADFVHSTDMYATLPLH